MVVRSASPRNLRAAEALRGAVGLLAGGLEVCVVLVEDGAAAFTLAGGPQKALSTLRALGAKVLVETESLSARGLSAPDWIHSFGRAELPALLGGCDAVEAWR